MTLEVSVFGPSRRPKLVKSEGKSNERKTFEGAPFVEVRPIIDWCVSLERSKVSSDRGKKDLRLGVLFFSSLPCLHL